MFQKKQYNHELILFVLDNLFGVFFVTVLYIVLSLSLGVLSSTKFTFYPLLRADASRSHLPSVCSTRFLERIPPLPKDLPHHLLSPSAASQDQPPCHKDKRFDHRLAKEFFCVCSVFCRRRNAGEVRTVPAEECLGETPSHASPRVAVGWSNGLSGFAH